jgi:hypothetical protein
MFFGQDMFEVADLIALDRGQPKREHDLPNLAFRERRSPHPSLHERTPSSSRRLHGRSRIMPSSNAEQPSPTRTIKRSTVSRWTPRSDWTAERKSTRDDDFSLTARAV